MTKIKTLLINLTLVILGLTAAACFFYEWQKISTASCMDLKDFLHPSRRLMAEYDPYFYINPYFEESEFTDGQTAHDLLNRIKQDDIPVPSAPTELASLNLLLDNNNLVRTGINPIYSSGTKSNNEYFKIQFFNTFTHDDDIKINREILESVYPLQCPPLAHKNDLTINKPSTLKSSSERPVSASPSLLVTFYPVFCLPYEVVKHFWFLFTWALFLLSVHLLSGCARWKDGTKIVWIIALLFIVTNYSWYVHIIRGQKYVLYLFLLSSAYYFLIKKNFDIFSGFIIGCLITFRPNAILTLIPFLFFKRWKILSGMGVGIFIGILLPTLFTGPEIWKSYLDAIDGKHHQITTAYMYGNSEFAGASSDLQFSRLFEDPPICNVCAIFFRSNTDFIYQIVKPLSDILKSFWWFVDDDIDTEALRTSLQLKRKSDILLIEKIDLPKEIIRTKKIVSTADKLKYATKQDFVDALNATLKMDDFYAKVDVAPYKSNLYWAVQKLLENVQKAKELNKKFSQEKSFILNKALLQTIYPRETCNSFSKNTLGLRTFYVVMFILLSIKWFQRPLLMKNTSNDILLLIGGGFFVLSNYFLCLNHSYACVLWIFPIALIIIHSNSFLYFARTSLLPVSFFLFFTAIGWNWFPVPGLGLMLGQFVLLISLPFIILDLLQRP